MAIAALAEHVADELGIGYRPHAPVPAPAMPRRWTVDYTAAGELELHPPVVERGPQLALPVIVFAAVLYGVRATATVAVAVVAAALAAAVAAVPLAIRQLEPRWDRLCLAPGGVTCGTDFDSVHLPLAEVRGFRPLLGSGGHVTIGVVSTAGTLPAFRVTAPRQAPRPRYFPLAEVQAICAGLALELDRLRASDADASSPPRDAASGPGPSGPRRRT